MKMLLVKVFLWSERLATIVWVFVRENTLTRIGIHYKVHLICRDLDNYCSIPTSFKNAVSAV